MGFRINRKLSDKSKSDVVPEFTSINSNRFGGMPTEFARSTDDVNNDRRERQLSVERRQPVVAEFTERNSDSQRYGGMPLRPASSEDIRSEQQSSDDRRQPVVGEFTERNSDSQRYGGMPLHPASSKDIRSKQQSSVDRRQRVVAEFTDRNSESQRYGGMPLRPASAASSKGFVNKQECSVNSHSQRYRGIPLRPASSKDIRSEQQSSDDRRQPVVAKFTTRNSDSQRYGGMPLHPASSKDIRSEQQSYVDRRQPVVAEFTERNSDSQRYGGMPLDPASAASSKGFGNKRQLSVNSHSQRFGGIPLHPARSTDRNERQLLVERRQPSPQFSNRPSHGCKNRSPPRSTEYFCGNGIERQTSVEAIYRDDFEYRNGESSQHQRGRPSQFQYSSEERCQSRPVVREAQGAHAKSVCFLLVNFP